MIMVYEKLPGGLQDILQRVYANSIYKADTFVLEWIIENNFEILTNDEIKSKQNINCWEYGSCINYTVTAPAGVDKDIFVDSIKDRKNIIGTESSGEYTVAPEQPFICELSDALIIPPYGIVMTNENEFPARVIQHGNPRGSDVHRLQKTWRSLGRVRTLLELKKDHDYDETVYGSLVLSRVYPQKMAYANFLLEYIPKLRAFEEYIRHNDCDLTILLDPRMTRWQREVLDSIDIAATFKQWDRNFVRAERFVLPIHRRGSDGFCSSDLDWIDKKCSRNIDTNNLSESPNRVYLSRENYNRSLENRDQVINMLSKYGFEICKPENLSLKKQISLFKGADVITGPVGSGFTNIIFCDDTTLFPIHPPDTFHTYFYELATVLDIKNIPVFGDLSNQAENTTSEVDSFTGLSHTSNSYNQNFSISPERLEKAMKDSIKI